MNPLAIIIVTYDHAATLAATLASVATQTLPGIAVVVVENGDGSSAAVARTALPSATVIIPGLNLGFAGGCNLGVAHTTAPMLAFVNPDVTLAPDWAVTIVAALGDPTIGIVGGKLRFPDGRLQHAGGMVQWPLAFGAHHGYGLADAPPFDVGRAVEYVTGASLALRRTTWEAVGGFDPAFHPAYYEEVDLCLRVAALGLTVRYEPAAWGTHLEVGGKGKGAGYYALYHLNRLRLLWKHRSDAWLFRHWLPAELAHLRTTADDAEITGLLWAYGAWQRAFLGAEPTQPTAPTQLPTGPTLPSNVPAPLQDWQLRIDPPTTDEWNVHNAERAIIPGELGWAVQQVLEKGQLTPLAFHSRWPLVAALRTTWNRIATESYLRPLIQQQNDYNAALRDLAHALARQRRTSDGAALMQGVLWAKMMYETLPADESAR